MYCSGQNTTTVPCETKAPHILSHLEAICGQKCHIEDGPLGQLLRTIATLMKICRCVTHRHTFLKSLGGYLWFLTKENYI